MSLGCAAGKSTFSDSGPGEGGTSMDSGFGTRDAGEPDTGVVDMPDTGPPDAGPVETVGLCEACTAHDQCGAGNWCATMKNSC